MSQHDMDLDNQLMPPARADITAALKALVSNSSGATEPATMFAFQFWADTTTGLLKIRNAANSAWVTVGTMATANLGHLLASAVSAFALTYLDDADADTARATLVAAGTGVSNTFTGNQSITGDLTLTSNDAGAGAAPSVTLMRNSASPAANDDCGSIDWRGRDSAAASTAYARLFMRIIDLTDATEDSELRLQTFIAGTLNTRFIWGQGMYSLNATGGDKGVDTINAKAVYDDNVLLTCYVLEAALKGVLDVEKWDGRVPNLIVPKQRRQTGRLVPTGRKEKTGAIAEDGSAVERDELKPETVEEPAREEVRLHTAARRFAAELMDCLDPAVYAQRWKATGVLPGMPSPKEWADRGGNLPTGEVIQRLWQTVELQAVHIEELRRKLP